MLQNLPFKELWSKEPTGSKLALGIGTSHISLTFEFKTTGSSTPFLLDRNTASSVPLLTPSKKVDFVMQNIIQPSSQ
jgi:hypothetical protein